MKFETKIKRVGQLNERVEKYREALRTVKKTSRLTPQQIFNKTSLVYQIKKIFGLKPYLENPFELKDLDFEEEFKEVLREYLKNSINRDLEELRELLNKYA
jgi:hypothetical protein